MIQQLSVLVENEIGSLAGVTKVLKENDINIKAIASLDTPEFAIMRLIVDQPDLAREVLGSKGFVVKMSQAIAVELVDQPGDLDKMLNIIADAKICINYIYSFVLRDGKTPFMVFNTDDIEQTAKILKEVGFVISEEEDLI